MWKNRGFSFVLSFYRNISVFHFSLFSIHFPFAGSHKTFAAGAKTLLVFGVISKIGKILFCGASGPFFYEIPLSATPISTICLFAFAVFVQNQ
jgi:hypothetical protein